MAASTSPVVQDRADELRMAMVNSLREEGVVVSDAVAAAFSAIPRHLFAPGETLEAAYAPHGTVVPRRGADGLLTSVISAPNIQAMMLEPAGIEPGMRVLEIGSGGYNAALIAELTGPDGKVTTVDIDAEVTDRARSCLDEAGYEQVQVVQGDAEDGVPGGAPYDRIVVTAGSWDIPPAWLSQLTPSGRLVVPLRFRGLTRTVTFDRDGDGLVSRHYQLAAFVPFQGAGAHADRKVMVTDGVVVHTDDPAVRIDPATLNAALGEPSLELWTGAAYDFPDEVSLFTTMNAPCVVQLHASQEAIDRGVTDRRALHGVPALIAGDSIAYRMAREVCDNPGSYESGVIAHGPQGKTLADQHAELLRRWAASYCRRGTALFRYTPGTPVPGPLPEGTVVKPHGVLTVTWP